MPARLTLDTTVALRAGLVTLVTFDAEQRVLRLVQAP
jgi:hypothetical protein